MLQLDLTFHSDDGFQIKLLTRGIQKKPDTQQTAEKVPEVRANCGEVVASEVADAWVPSLTVFLEVVFFFICLNLIAL